MPADDFDLKREMEQMREMFVPPETDLKRGLARHPWLLLGVAGSALTLAGILIGPAMDSNQREHAHFRAAIEEHGRWMTALDRRVESQEVRLANYGDDSRRALRMMEDFQRESYEFWKAAAEERGDTRAVRRIAEKLRKLPTPVPPTLGNGVK